MFSLLAISLSKKSVWDINPCTAELEITKLILLELFFSLIGAEISFNCSFLQPFLNSLNLNLGTLLFLKKEP